MKWMAFWFFHSPLLICVFSFLDSLNPFSSSLLHQFLPLTPQKKFSSHTPLFKIRAPGTASEKLEFGIWISLWQKQGESVCGRLEPWERIQRNSYDSPRVIYRHTTAQWPTDSYTGEDLPLWHLHKCWVGQGVPEIWEMGCWSPGRPVLGWLLNASPTVEAAKWLYYNYHFYIANAPNIFLLPPLCSLVFKKLVLLLVFEQTRVGWRLPEAATPSPGKVCFLLDNFFTSSLLLTFTVPDIG